MQGFNTDADAIVRALREDLGFEPTGGKVALLGAGGAGRVAALRLAGEGVAQLWLINRTEPKARVLAEELQQAFPLGPTRVAVGYPTEPVDLVLNATSAGLHPADPLPFDPAGLDLRQVQAAFDMIYRPAETPFLARAKAAGCRTANGFGMLLYQGAAALEIWSGRAAPIEVMREALRQNIYGVPA
jgi:shikimate dehydrogenase